MNIKAYPTNNPTPRREWDWRAYDADTYDMTDIGEDGRAYSDHPVGEGRTKAEAIADFLSQLEPVDVAVAMAFDEIPALPALQPEGEGR